jgi:hypothetical protein
MPPIPENTTPETLAAERQAEHCYIVEQRKPDMKTEHAIDWRKSAAEIQDDFEAVCKQRDELLAALQSISKITGDAGFNIGGPLEHCPGEISADDAKRLLSLACEYLKDTSKAASRAIASVESYGRPEKTAKTEGGA